MCIRDRCRQVLEIKIGSYANVKGGMNHYSHYICRGVKQHTGCENIGRVVVSSVELAVFESVLFKHPSELTKPGPHTDTSQLIELENQLAKVQLTIARFSEMVRDVELQEVADLKAGLKASVMERAALTKRIEVEKNRINQKLEFPKAASTLFNMLSFEKPDLKKYAEWYEDYNRFVQNTENRKMLKNLMPNIFERIELRFNIDESKPPQTVTDITCTLIGGESITARIIASSSHTIISKNNPETKAPKQFQLTTNGERLPVK